MKEREQAKIIIQENEKEKLNRLKEKEADRQLQIKLQEDYIKELDRKDKQRADEWAAREAKIQNAMNKMAETVLKKSNAAEKELERRVLQYAEEREKKAAADEKSRKQKVKQRDIEVKQTLDKQMEEKRKIKAQEFAKNKEYVAKVIA